MSYQAIRHTHYQRGHRTRSIEDLLTRLMSYAVEKRHNVTIVSVNLVEKDWKPHHYEVLDWHILIWSLHTFTDDELAPFKFFESDEED